MTAFAAQRSILLLFVSRRCNRNRTWARWLSTSSDHESGQNGSGNENENASSSTQQAASSSSNSVASPSTPASTTATGDIDRTASTKLFADAARPEEREAEERAAQARLRVEQLAASLSSRYETNGGGDGGASDHWTGEERMKDALLRMHMESRRYRPLRTGVVKSAEEKVRAHPPRVDIAVDLDEVARRIRMREEGETNSSAGAGAQRQRQGQLQSQREGEESTRTSIIAETPLVPSKEGVEQHKPWLVTFRAPSFDEAAVKHARIPPKLLSLPFKSKSRGSASGTGAAAGTADEDGETKKKEPPVEQRRRIDAAERVGRAREATLNYRLGLHGARGASGGPEGVQRRSAPVGMKAWGDLIEERIERARREGQFKSLKGRGKPLERDAAEGNPFIAREEFFLNRIVQRNQAAPPWVELQLELESALHAFRTALQDAWTRRVVRMLTLSLQRSSSSPSITSTASSSIRLLESLTPEYVSTLRDAAWEERERTYHDAAIAELNALVRRYNGVAPYAVRRATLTRESELERCFKVSSKGVMRGVKERLRSGLGGSGKGALLGDEDEFGSGGGGGGGEGGKERAGEKERQFLGVWEVIRGWFT